MVDVTWVPPGKQTFIDDAGNPLVGGKVWHYIPTTSTFKDTYQDIGGTILNTNPVILNARGQAIIYGPGLFRQRLTDANNNEIWDRVTGIQTTGGAGSSPVALLSYLYEGDDPPPTGCLLGGWTLPYAALWPADFAGSTFHVEAGHLPTATYLESIKLNGVQVGTLSISTGGVATFTTTNPLGFASAALDRLTLRGPTADATFNQFYGTFVGAFVL